MTFAGEHAQEATSAQTKEPNEIGPLGDGANRPT